LSWWSGGDEGSWIQLEIVGLGMIGRDPGSQPFGSFAPFGSSVQEHLDFFPADLAPAESQCTTKASGVCALAELTQELRDRRKVRCIFSGMARRLKKSLEGAAQHQQAEITFDHRAMLRLWVKFWERVCYEISRR